MVTRRSSDAQPPATPIAPVVKRKRRASCLGEQERRERKRAIDREAQRSLREKTKTHIAELERTIQILRDQDRNEATASLLKEIEGLRAENERLRDIIDGVKSVVGSELLPRKAHSTNGTGDGNVEAKSPAPSSAGAQSPQPRQSPQLEPQHESKPVLHRPSPPHDRIPPATNTFDFRAPMPATSRRVDLDGMVLSDLNYSSTDSNLEVGFGLDPVEEVPDETNMLPRPDSPATAAFAPFIKEIFGSEWRCPSPIVLHIGNPSTSSTTQQVCPTWRRSNELFGKVFSYRPGTASALNARLHSMEAGFLFLGIKDGWSNFDEWQQSPALKILKSVDEFLFANLPRKERLAVAYKSFKLLKYYLSATKSDLEKVPKWLHPSPSQSQTNHPIAIDFFAWPTLRSRLLATHPTAFTNSDLSHGYSHYLRFNWPFSFEDTFFYDNGLDAWCPSPLFERYHNDLKYWGLGEEFFERFPEIRGDVEGDWRTFGGEVC